MVLKCFTGVKRILDSVVSNLIKAIFIILNGAVKTLSPFSLLPNTKVNFKKVCLLTLSSGATSFILTGKHTSAPRAPRPPPALPSMASLPVAQQLLAIPRDHLLVVSGFFQRVDVAALPSASKVVKASCS